MVYDVNRMDAKRVISLVETGGKTPSADGAKQPAQESLRLKPGRAPSEEECSGESTEARAWELVRAERERAIDFAYHMTGDREAAKDIAQEAFLKAFRALPRFRGEAKLSTWFFRILVNTVKNYRRRNWRRLLRHEQTDDSPLKGDDAEQEAGTRQPDEAAGDSEFRRRIEKALECLSPGQRIAFSLVHLEEMTVSEAAEAMGISPGTVKSHLHRALGKLREELSDCMET